MADCTIRAVNSKMNQKVVVIGGGTGSFTLLSGLKKYPADITALVNMADDGGSTGVLRDELGVLPSGDVRQCLVALSNADKLREVFNYRFSEGSLEGHSLGNLFLSAVEKMTNSFEEAVALASDILKLDGQVVPVTTTKSRLVLRQQDGELVKGQFKIGNLNFLGKKRPEISLEPEAALTKKGAEAIEAADLIVIAPGNLYGSIAPALVVKGMKEALKSARAKIVYIVNLVTKPNQTDGFFAHDYADEIERIIGAPVLDCILYNTDEPTPALLEKYIHEGEKIVEFDLQALEKKHYKAIGLPMIAKKPVEVVAGDKISRNRSLIRHDSDVVALQLMNLE